MPRAPHGEGGPGTDTRFHNKSLFGSGDPTKARDGFCRGRMAGPYPSDATRVVARFRVECREKNDLIFETFVARLKNLDANYGATVSARRCLPAHATRRSDAAGVAWWGCSHSLTVADALSRNRARAAGLRRCRSGGRSRAPR